LPSPEVKSKPLTKLPGTELGPGTPVEEKSLEQTQSRFKAVSYAIVGTGGFLGLAKHDVAIPVSQFKLVDKKLVLPGATKEALKAIPEFQYAQ